MTTPTAQTLLQSVAAQAETIRAHSSWAEKNGRLHEASVTALVAAGVPRLYLPESLQGYAVEPSVCAQVCEALADVDSAAAWHVMVINAARLMAAYWPEEMVEHLWLEKPDTIVAASGHTPLQGEPVDGGFIVTGRNSFVSGCHHADFVMSPMMVGARLFTVVLPQSSCEIVDNWDTYGMRGTGSNDVIVSGAFVPTELSCAMDVARTRNKYYQGQLYDCPSRVVFATYIPIALSLARRALEIVSELASDKTPYATDKKLRERSAAQIHYGRGLGMYRSARVYFYDALEQVWQRAGKGDSFCDQDRAELYLAGTHTMQTCAEVVNHVADAAGSSIFVKGQPLEQIVRDMQTLKHHGFANESRYGSVAQVMWGATLDYPLLLR